MLAIIGWKIFCLAGYYAKIQRTLILLIFCMDMKLVRSHWGRNVGWGCLRTGHWREYLGLKGRGNKEWNKVSNEKLNDLYSSPNIIRGMKSGIMRWAGYVAYMGKGEVHTEFWWWNLRERNHLEHPGVVGRIILRKWDGAAWTGLIWLRTGAGNGLENCNNSSA